MLCSHPTVGNGAGGHSSPCNKAAGPNKHGSLIFSNQHKGPTHHYAVYMIKKIVIFCRLQINHKTNVFECAFTLGVLAWMIQ
jgi:hypothetical protein